jgi:hypothetical protein
VTRPSALHLRDRIAIALLALALVVRVLVPAGWMPAQGNGLAITLCSGSGAVAAWVDADGKIRKQDPAKGAMPDHPCAFAGLGAPMLGGELSTPALLRPAPRDEVAALHLAPAAIGKGLAAPPPPATGPPATV